MSKVRGSFAQLKVARVLHEDEGFMTLEVAKDDNRPLRIEDGDRFLTILFLHKVPGSNDLEAWLPWEH